MTLLARSKIASSTFTNPRCLPSKSRKRQTHFLLLISVLCLTAITAVSGALYKAANIHEQIKAQAVLSLSFQDLTLQSINLRHLAGQHSAQVRLSLEKNGYDTGQSLLNQLSARLAVLEAVPTPDDDTSDTQNTLRTLLETMDQSWNTRQMVEQTHIDQWQLLLKKLSQQFENAPGSNQPLVKQLIAQNQTLGMSLIALACLPLIGVVSFKLSWLAALERKRHEKIIQRSSDPITDLLNEHGWLHLLHLHHKSKTGQGNASAVALIQIDYFKQYNATYGPTVGDARLQKFASMLSANFRPQDTLARLGSEQFAVLVPDCGALETKRIIDRIRQDANFELEFSCGICELSCEASLERIMALADHALNKARQEGGNRSCLA